MQDQTTRVGISIDDHPNTLVHVEFPNNTIKEIFTVVETICILFLMHFNRKVGVIVHTQPWRVWCRVLAFLSTLILLIIVVTVAFSP